MNKNYVGNGKLVTRLLGRLEIFHGDGVIEFRLRSESEIEKRGVKTVLCIINMPDIPRIEDGTSITIDLAGRTVDFNKNREIHSDRPERSERAS